MQSYKENDVLKFETYDPVNNTFAKQLVVAKGEQVVNQNGHEITGILIAPFKSDEQHDLALQTYRTSRGTRDVPDNYILLPVNEGEYNAYTFPRKPLFRIGLYNGGQLKSGFTPLFVLDHPYKMEYNEHINAAMRAHDIAFKTIRDSASGREIIPSSRASSEIQLHGAADVQKQDFGASRPSDNYEHKTRSRNRLKLNQPVTTATHEPYEDIDKDEFSAKSLRAQARIARENAAYKLKMQMEEENKERMFREKERKKKENMEAQKKLRKIADDKKYELAQKIESERRKQMLITDADDKRKQKAFVTERRKRLKKFEETKVNTIGDALLSMWGLTQY
jgi:hypothetical protein